MEVAEMKINRLVPWFGANGANAHVPAKLLGQCTWVYIPFAGSMAEIPHFRPSVQIMVSDLHNELLTLAQVVSQYSFKDELVRRLESKLFHPETLDRAKEVLIEGRRQRGKSLFSLLQDHKGKVCGSVDIAEAYFTVAWMGRSAVAGTKGEERVGLALRYDAGGGDPVKRFDSAVASLDGWHNALKRCQFTREDVFEVITRLRKKVAAKEFGDHAIGMYCDPPWPDDGDGYLHTFTEDQHRRLASVLSTLPCRTVVRYGDHPLIRDLYPESKWIWHVASGRDQHRKAKAEVFLERKEST